MLRGVNHPSEVTQSPIEIQLSTLRTTLGNDLVRDLEDSVAPNTWRAYRSDLADFATWVAYTSAEWKAPEVVATYLRTLEDGGAAYATITRRLTSIHKLVAIAAIAADVLVCARGGYVAVDVKHHRTIDAGDAVLLTSTLAVPTPTAAALVAGSELRADKDDALQLAHYRRMLQAHGWAAPTSLGGIIGKERRVVWYNLDEAMWTTPAKSDGKRRKRRTTMEVYDFEFEFRRDKAADAVAGRPLLPPVRIAVRASCGWRERCHVDLEAGSGDPSLIPRVGYRQWRTLKDAGITNRAEVASLDYPIAVLATTVDLTRWYADAVNADPNTPIDDLRPRARTQTQVLLDAGILTAAGLLARIDYPTSELNGAGFLPPGRREHPAPPHRPPLPHPQVPR